MPIIRGTHNGRAAIVIVAIMDAAKYKEHKQSDHPVFQGAVPFNALIDTGATSTMISSWVANQLGLEQVNKIEFSSLDGTAWRRGYLFHVGFYTSPPAGPSERSGIQVLKRAINGGELPAGHTFDVLLGMDVLTTGTLHVSRDGKFSFLFGE